MGSGPSSEQKAAAARQAEAAKLNADTTRSMLNIWREQFSKIEPFATSRLNNGLPFIGALTDFNNGVSAQAAIPARANLLRSLGNMDNVPDGFKAQLLADFENQRRRDYDANLVNSLLMNEQGRYQAAGLLTGQQAGANPLGWANATTNSNSSIMEAPLQGSSWLGPVAGAVSGLGGSLITNWGKQQPPPPTSRVTYPLF